MSSSSLRRSIRENIREIVFGLEDALVSTLGALTGIAIGAQSSHIVILSGFVLLAAEATSMAAGSYLSSKSADKAEEILEKQSGDRHHHTSHPMRAGVVMGVCYFLGGIIPLFPYFILPLFSALVLSIPLTALVLFFVGYWSGAYTGRSRIRSGFEMTLISLSAALLGYLIARVVSWYFGVDVVT